MSFKLFNDYKQADLSKGLALLYTNRTLGAIAGSLMALFLPVFYYLKFDMSVSNVILLYIFNFGLQYFLVIPGAQIMSKIGIRNSIVLSVPFICLFYICLYFIEWNILWMAILGYIFVNFYKALYWVPYHTSFAKFSHSGKRGRQMSLLTVISDTIQVFVPLISSFMIVEFGFNYLFVLALIIQLLAIFPALLMSSVDEKFTWTYRQTYKEMFSKKHRNMFWAYFGDGIQSMVGLIIWPIFIWLLFDKQYEVVGLISAAIILISMILRLVIGDWTDRFSKNKVLKTGTLLYAIGWIFKMFVVTTFHVFIISAYHNLAAIILRTPFDTGMYDKTADWGHYADEYSVAREMILSIGRVFSMVIMLIMLFYLPLSTVFIIAAFGSLLMNALLHHVDYEPTIKDIA